MRQACLIALCLIWTTPARAENETLSLISGQQKIISAPGVTRIAVANPNVADVKVVDAGQVLVTAVGSGQTELTVWRGSKVTTYDVRVTSMDPRQIKKEVEKVLEGREGIRVRIVKDTVVVEGSVLTLADLEKAEEVVQLYPQVKNLVKLDPSAHAHIAEAINKELAAAGMINARAVVVGATIFIEGMVDTEADLQKAEIVTRAIAKNVQSVLRVGASRMVELDVEFVEISKNSLDRIGINWPTDLSGEINLEYVRREVLRGAQPNEEYLRGEAGLKASLGLTLQFNDGISRTLARPRLVAASNQEATFLAGGEVPIPISTLNQVYVEFKEYGIRLKITPVVEASNTIQTKILAEISDIDPSVSVMGIPGFTSRRVETEVTVKDGQTIVLSGLLHLTEGKDITKIPILGHIPIIGELFKSRSFRERQTELAVFVTPRIVDPLSSRVKDLSKHMSERYNEAGDDVGFSLLD